MRKYWWKILLVAIFVLVVIPLVIAWMHSFTLIKTDTSNEWIGFWGGYLGSILGGMITLLVMYFTIKDNKENLKITLAFEKERMLNQQKLQFNNGLLEEVVNFHTIVENIITSLRGAIVKMNYPEKLNDKVTSDIPKLVNLCKLITIQLYSKQNNSEYKCIELLIQSVGAVVKSVNALTCIKADGMDIEVFKNKSLSAIDDIKQNADKLLTDIETYYTENTEN